MIKACDLKLPIDRRKGRTSHRKPPATTGSCRPKPITGVPKGFNRVGNTGCVFPEQTEAGRRHRMLFAKWLNNPTREAWIDAYLSAYC